MKPLFLLAEQTSAATLLAPAGLALLGALVPLVILYILKIKRQRKVVSSTWLWAAAQRDLLARSPFRKFIAQVPFIVQAIAIALLSLALARPATRGRQLTGDHVAIIIDASASMSASAGDSGGRPVTRMAAAKRTASDIVSALTPGSDAIVIEAGRDARVVSPLDRDLVRVKAAIERVQARDVEGDLGSAIGLAVDRLRALGGTARVVVLTDGNLARPSALGGAALPIEVILVGTPMENAAIVRVDVRSATIAGEGGGEQVQAFLVVANFGAKARDLYVTMREEGASDVLASRRILVQPGERQPVVLTFHPTPGDYRKGLLFDISPHDAMPVDDEAYGRVPAGDKLPAFLAGKSPWIERALASDAQVDLKTGTVEELASARVGLDTFVVIDGDCPRDPPGGDLLVVNPKEGPCFGTVVGRPLADPQITSWETGDPRLRFLTLDGVHVAKAHALAADGQGRSLIRAREETLATDISTARGMATLIGFDVGESDWPLKASFVLFIRNVVEQARAHRATGSTGSARTGEPLVVNLPGTAEKVEATGPEGERLDVSPRAGVVVIPDIAHVGFYRVSWQGPQAGNVIIPANLTSAAESDLTTKPPASDGQAVIVSKSDKDLDAHNEWTGLIALLVLAFLVFDVWYFTRDPRASAARLIPVAPPIARPAAKKRGS